MEWNNPISLRSLLSIDFLSQLTFQHNVNRVCVSIKFFILYYWLNFRGLNSLNLKSEAAIFSLVWFPPQPLTSWHSHFIWCRGTQHHVPGTRAPVTYVWKYNPIYNLVETTLNFDWTLFNRQVIIKTWLSLYICCK